MIARVAMVLALLAFGAAPALAEDGLSAKQQAAFEASQLRVFEDGDSHRVIYGKGDPITEMHFAQLTGVPGAPEGVEAYYAHHETLAWLFAGTAAGMALFGMSVPFWLNDAFSADNAGLGYPLTILPLFAAGGVGYFAYQEFMWLEANVNSISPPNPFFDLERARQMSDRYNQRLRQQVQLKVSFAF